MVYDPNAHSAPRRNYRTESQHTDRPAQTTISAAPPQGRNPEPRQSQGNSDGDFVNITGLFPSKSGKADNVVVTPAICDILNQIQPGDILGVSEMKKTKRLSLWFIKK